MEHGDFTNLAKFYINRAGYSRTVLELILKYSSCGKEPFVVCDVGAGTGKLTENLIELGLRGVAVEPNESMRLEAVSLAAATTSSFEWKEGSAEKTGLPDDYADWVLMGSSFHWTNHTEALKEFKRILKPKGFLTVLWNPRNIEGNSLHERIEKIIEEMIPNLKRVSSGSPKHMHNVEEKLLSTCDFNNLFYIEAPHEVIMTKERYIGAWRSVNDIQVQAGQEKFEIIIQKIKKEISVLKEVAVPYKTRAWTVQAI